MPGPPMSWWVSTIDSHFSCAVAWTFTTRASSGKWSAFSALEDTSLEKPQLVTVGGGSCTTCAVPPPNEKPLLANVDAVPPPNEKPLPTLLLVLLAAGDDADGVDTAPPPNEKPLPTLLLVLVAAGDDANGVDAAPPPNEKPLPMLLFVLVVAGDDADGVDALFGVFPPIHPKPPLMLLAAPAKPEDVIIFPPKFNPPPVVLPAPAKVNPPGGFVGAGANEKAEVLLPVATPGVGPPFGLATLPKVGFLEGGLVPNALLPPLKAKLCIFIVRKRREQKTLKAQPSLRK